MDRLRALRTLGLASEVDPSVVKQRYRALVRQHHPDRGGDPTTFHALQAAYELLAAGAGVVPGRSDPAVARGRPSRSEGAEGAARRLDDLVLDATAAALMRRIAASGRSRLLSRAPGARTNRFAPSLAGATTTTLTLTLLDRAALSGTVSVRVELTGRGRAARRALTTLDLSHVPGATWTRRRGDAMTMLEAVIGADDVAAAAHRSAAATVRLLLALDWPLEQWYAD